MNESLLVLIVVGSSVGILGFTVAELWRRVQRMREEVTVLLSDFERRVDAETAREVERLVQAGFVRKDKEGGLLLAEPMDKYHGFDVHSTWVTGDGVAPWVTNDAVALWVTVPGDVRFKIDGTERKLTVGSDGALRAE